MRSVLIVVTHLLGSGHLVRAAQLARALSAGGFAVTLASGGMPLRSMEGEPFAFLQLPPVRVEGVDFRNLLDESGIPVAQSRMAARIAALEEASAQGPDVVITEHFPFGRRQLAGEFLALIAAARRANPGLVVLSSIRDVLVTPKPSRIAEAEDRLADLFDAVLVHGEEKVLPLGRSWPVKPPLSEKLRYVGYLAERASVSRPLGRVEGSEAEREIIVSGGGSAAALPLFQLALAAARLSPSGRRWRVLVGRGVSEAAFLDLVACAPSHVAVERARPDFPTLLAKSALSVSQAGYNTVLDLVTAGGPAIVVPFDAGGETEQGLRAEALAQARLATCLRLETLTPQRLADEAVVAMARPAPTASILIDDGRRAVAAVKLLLDPRR